MTCFWPYSNHLNSDAFFSEGLWPRPDSIWAYPLPKALLSTLWSKETSVPTYVVWAHGSNFVQGSGQACALVNDKPGYDCVEIETPDVYVRNTDQVADLQEVDCEWDYFFGTSDYTCWNNDEFNP